MTKERAQELLEDIRPTSLRLKQVNYLLSLPDDTESLRAVSYGEKVATYTTGDNTANTVISKIDKRKDLEAERDELRTKLELYMEWLSGLSEIYQELASDIYIDGHSYYWIAQERSCEISTLYVRRARMLESLAETEIFVLTEPERRKRNERNDQ